MERLDSLMLLNFRSGSLVDLAKTLNQHQFMYRLQIHLAEGTLNGEILGVMATASRLTHVQVHMKESCAIGILLNSKSIQTLSLASENVTLAKSHISTLVYGLQSNISLTSLDLASELSLEDFRSLCVALKANYRLESIQLSLKLPTEEDSQIAAVELANLLKVNRSLLSIWNYSYKDTFALNKLSKRILYGALENNSTIEQIKLFSEEPHESWGFAQEDGVLGIQRRDNHKFSNEEIPSISSNVSSFDTTDSYLQEDCVGNTKFCDVFRSMPSCDDYAVPDIGQVIRKMTGTTTKADKEMMNVVVRL
jgi:hypothetical protein